MRWLVGVALVYSVTSQAQYHASKEAFLSANGTDTLAYDLYLPEQPVLSDWCVVFVHGGGFQSGSRNDEANQTYCRKLANLGLAVVSMDYRLRQKGEGFHCDVSTSDKREAIRWAAEDLEVVINEISPRFTLGIIACGSSAGAEAVLDAAFNMQIPQIKGIISLAGAVEPRNEWPPVPVLAFHGTCDALVPFCVAAHHYCPKESPGAMQLMGGGGLAKAHDLVKLFAFENAGHELASNLLSNPLFVEQSLLFTSAVASHTFAAQTITIPPHSACSLSNPPAFPCD